MPEIDPDVEWGWEYAAKCRDVEDPDIFYPERNAKTYKAIAASARAICFGKDGRPACPVRIPCLLYALKREDKLQEDERHGIWGGLSHRERNHLLRKWRSTAPELDLAAFVQQTQGSK